MELPIRAGKIYVLRNEHMRELIVKVGKTLRTSEERAKELSSATGVVGRFHVLIQEEVADVDRAEKLVHERLASYRLQPNREYFQVPYELAIRTVFDVCNQVNADLVSSVRRVMVLLGGSEDPKKLMELLAPHRGGNLPVIVHFDNGEASCDVHLGENWRVKFSSLLVRELQTWLGVDGVMFGR